MRTLLTLSALVLGASAMSSAAQAGCNLRGEFCGYPSWASNAFATPHARVSEALLEPDRPPLDRHIAKPRRSKASRYAR
jgi:hypothetical protein